MTTFARLTHLFQKALRQLPPCCRVLYEWLLERSPAGHVQEVFLEDFAKEFDYTPRHARNCLKQLMEAALIERIRRYSANVYRLIAHDDRTLNLATLQKKSEGDQNILQDCEAISETEPSKPYSTVTKNREEFRDNRDTLPLHPVEEIDRGDGLVKVLEPEVAGVLEPELVAEIRKTLQQPLNKNILAAIAQYPEVRARDALDALREAIARGNPIRNLAGWFVKALHCGYKPNASRSSTPPTPAELPKPQTTPDGFRAWFELAVKVGVFIGSEQRNGELYVHSATTAEPYAQAQQTWPLARLEAMLKTPLDAPPTMPSPPKQAKTLPQGLRPSPEAVEDGKKRAIALSRLRAKWELPFAKGEAIAEAMLWGFEVTAAGVFEVAF